MELFIITPGVKSLSWAEKKQLSDSKLVFISNPLYQDKFRRYGSVESRFLTDDDFIDDKHLADLVEAAKYWGWNWFLQEELKKEFSYGDVDLRCLFTQELTLYLVKALKIIDLYSVIFEKYNIDKVIIFDDGSEWGTFAMRMSQQRQIPVKNLFQNKPVTFSWNGFLIKFAKTILRLMHRFTTLPIKHGSVLYSAAPRFVRPFFERRESSYYLRDAFSAEAWKISRQYNFVHILPDNFKSRQNLSELNLRCDVMVSKIDDFFNERTFFLFRQINLWPIIHDDFIVLARRNFFAGMQLINQFLKMFNSLNFRVVLVDEEVCFLNKTLVQVANTLRIPTFCLEHGAPMESIGSVPSSVMQILAWGEPSRDRLCEWGIPADKIRLTGAPQFKLAARINYATCRSLVAKKLKMRPETKYLLLAAFPFDTNEVPTFSRISHGIKIQKNSLRVAIEVLETYTDMHLVVKFHPGEENMNFSEAIIARITPSIKQRIHFVTQFDASVLITGAYAVLTTASTMYFEALLQEKPVFLLDLAYNRIGEFLSKNFLDLEHFSECVAFLVYHLDPNHISENMSLQKKEIKRHFYNENKNAVDVIWEIMASSSGITA